jgi:hypothetical protein
VGEGGERDGCCVWQEGRGGRGLVSPIPDNFFASSASDGSKG